MSEENSLLADEKALDGVRFGRNRFLAFAGGLIFGLAGGLLGNTKLAWAACGWPPTPCEGPGICCCCSGSVCCQSNCIRAYIGCWSANGTCWNTCNGNGNLFQCCDWQSNEYCICRTIVGSC